MTRPSYFEGGDLSASDRAQVRKTARRLADAHPQLGFGFLWSATAFLMRAGEEELTDDAILTEARRRKGNLETAVANNRARVAQEAVR